MEYDSQARYPDACVEQAVRAVAKTLLLLPLRGASLGTEDELARLELTHNPIGVVARQESRDEADQEEKPANER